MSVGDDLASGMIRFSLGRFTTEQEISFAIEQVGRRAAELRAKPS
jgi:cysteine sulfinate desulfinase/cysteine desulfurase-like protein